MQKGQAAGKLLQIRANIRKQEVEQMRQRLRESIMEERMKQQEDKNIDSEVITLIGKQDIEGVYNVLIRSSKKKGLFGSLSSSTARLLFSFLITKAGEMRSWILMPLLIEHHYPALFLKEQSQIQMTLYVENIYAAILFAVQRLQTNPQEDQYQFLNGHLSVLKTLVFCKDEKDQHGNCFQVVQREDLLRIYLLPCFQVLSTNPIYLIIMALLEFDLQLSRNPFFTLYFEQHPSLLPKLIQQGDPDSCRSRASSLPSISLVNSIIRNINDPNLLLPCLSSYIRTAKIVYKYAQSSNTQYYKMATFINCLETLVDLFGKLRGQRANACFSKENFWVFAVILLRIEPEPVRQLIYRIIRLAVGEMIADGINPTEQLGEPIVGCLAEGLDQPKRQIVTIVLQICILLGNHCSQHGGPFLHWLNSHETQTSIEQMVYEKSKNGEMARSLDALLKNSQNFDEQM